MVAGVLPLAADDVEFIRVLAAVAARRHERLLAAAAQASQQWCGIHIVADVAHACTALPPGMIVTEHPWPWEN